MTIEEYFGDWRKVVDIKEANSIVKRLSASKMSICPTLKDVFKAFRLCPYNDLRVVIIGQDPYPDFYEGKPRATGIAFANSPEIPEDRFSPSLEILKESIIDFTTAQYSINFDPSLEKWEKQGVLMLNSALTCIAGKIGSHTLMWRPFMTSLLTNLSKEKAGIVYVLLGSQAAGLKSYINKKFNFILEESHPSWYARTKKQMPMIIWKMVNKILIDQNGYGIEWYSHNY